MATLSFTGLPPSNGSNGCVRQQRSFTSSKAKRSLALGTDCDNEAKNGFKSFRLFTLLVLLIVIEILL